jgi:chemotaxis protein methyltransferase CheR
MREVGLSMNLPELTSQDFQRISAITRQISGIDLQAGKEGLVISRLMRRVGALGASSFTEYVDRVESDPTGQELMTMLDALTTNKTSFFRESQHFDYLCSQILPDLRQSPRPFTVWSAGCSTGQEAYSLAILLNEELPAANRRHIRILATDMSRRVVEVAAKGRYEYNELEGIPAELLPKYFSRAGSTGAVEINAPAVRGMLTFARLNLMNGWPMKGPFDLILCRNVMIYFDQQTQHKLIGRFASMLRPGGHLFVGHAETVSGGSSELEYVQPAVYMKRRTR